MAELGGLVTTVLLSLTAFPVLKLLTQLPKLTESGILLSTSCIVLGIVVFLSIKFLPSGNKGSTKSGKKQKLLYYTCCLFSFSCVVDLIFFFEVVGYVEGFIAFYLGNGEKYFATPYGALSLIWDGTVNYALCLIIIYRIDNEKDCRNVVLYWSGTMVASLFTLVIGALSGSYGSQIMPATWLNIPYFLLPMHYLIKFLLQPRRETHKRSSLDKVGIFDFLLATCLVLGMVFTFIRGLAGLNSPFPIAQLYATQYEPYINDPTYFGKVWILFMLSFGIIVQIILVHGLFMKNSNWFLDWSILYAAMAIYGTYVHLAAQFMPWLETAYKIPDANQTFVVTANIFLPVTACAVLWRAIYSHRSHAKQH